MLTGSEPAMLSSRPCSSFLSTGSFGILSLRLRGTCASAPRFFTDGWTIVISRERLLFHQVCFEQLAAGVRLPRDYGIGFADRTTFIAGTFQGFVGDLGPQLLKRRRCRLVRVPFGFVRSPRHLMTPSGGLSATLVLRR